MQKVLAGEIAKLPRPPAAAVTAHARTRARASRTRGRRPAAARPSRTFGSRRARQPGRTGGHGPTYQPLLVYVCVWRPLVFVGALALASSVLRLTAMNPNSQYGDKFIHGVLAKEPKFPAPSPRLAPHDGFRFMTFAKPRARAARRRAFFFARAADLPRDLPRHAWMQGFPSKGQKPTTSRGKNSRRLRRARAR